MLSRRAHAAETSPGLAKAMEHVKKMNKLQQKNRFDESSVVDVAHDSTQQSLVDLLGRTSRKQGAQNHGKHE